MYGQQGRGSWQQGADSWQHANGCNVQNQQSAYNQPQGYWQRNQQQPVYQYQPPPTIRQQQQQLQNYPLQHRSHTPNPRPMKRVRQDDTAAAVKDEPFNASQHQQPSSQAHRMQQQQYQQQPTYLTPATQQLPQCDWQPQQQLQQQVHNNLRQQYLHPMQQRSEAGTSMANSAASSTSVGSSRFPCSNHGNPAAATWLNALQQEVLSFAQQVVPNTEEQLQRQSRLTAFTTVVQEALPQHSRDLQVTLFGSGAAHLALHHSDLDVGITGLATPDGDNGGFDDTTKLFVVRCLKCIDRQARYGAGRHLLGVTSSRLVARARIPVLKLQLECGLELDVSVNDDGGLKAARFITSFQNDYPAIRPLILLLKSILKQRGLSEVYMGGLGSWSLANMVIAHLMSEDRAGAQADHVGSMLLSFLQRFGDDFDTDRQAVSVKQGGIVAKELLGTNFTRKRGQLALEDPLTGREVAGGSHRYADVEEVFSRLHERLAANLAKCQGATSTSRSRNGDSNSSRHIKFYYSDDEESEDDDEYGYDAANRSPTYQARMRRRRQQQQTPPQQQQSEFQLLEMVLDCQAALNRGAGAAAGAAAAAAGGGGDTAGGARWQWSNGAADRGPAPVVGRKRERW